MVTLFFMIYDTQPIDMSEVVEGGDPDAQVIGLVLQELDENKDLIFEWRSWDHIPITDAADRIDLTANRIDYVHGNSIEVGLDGNWLVSNRSLDEITKINRQTGEIMWRMGGKANEFVFDPSDGEPFFTQHDARQQENGNLTLFDNRFGTDSTYARAVEYEIDETNKIARRVWEYRAPSVNGSAATGSMQRLENGNSLIGWGTMYPTATEVDSNNQVLFELEFRRWGDIATKFTGTYRAFKLPWQGNPTQPPSLVKENLSNDTANLYFSWNGATEVDSYNLYAGTTNTSLALVQNIEKTGFEESAEVTRSISSCFYQIEPIIDSVPQVKSNILIDELCYPFSYPLPFINFEDGEPSQSN